MPEASIPSPPKIEPGPESVAAIVEFAHEGQSSKGGADTFEFASRNRRTAADQGDSRRVKSVCSRTFSAVDGVTERRNSEFESICLGTSCEVEHVRMVFGDSPRHRDEVERIDDWKKCSLDLNATLKYKKPTAKDRKRGHV